MKRFNWEFDFDPYYPAHFFEYTVVGRKDAMHWHRYVEIGLCLEGEGQFLYSYKQYPVEPGDIFINNDYENHVAVADAGQESRFIFLILMPSFISDSSNHSANQQYMKTFRYNPPDFVNRIAHSTETARRITRQIKRGYEVYQAKENMWEMELDIIVRRILLELALHYFRQEGEESARQKLNPKILAARSYMTQHYNQNVTLEEVARQVGLNTTYFRHLFKQETRISFKEYLTHLRLSNARQLLANSDISVQQVIEEVGYTNISQFYRVFRQHYHMTPAEYRRLQQGAKQS